MTLCFLKNVTSCWLWDRKEKHCWQTDLVQGLNQIGDAFLKKVCFVCHSKQTYWNTIFLRMIVDYLNTSFANNRFLQSGEVLVIKPSTYWVMMLRLCWTNTPSSQACWQRNSQASQKKKKKNISKEKTTTTKKKWLILSYCW